jgi:hypothetical protein
VRIKDAFPNAVLRRKLAALGIPAERHGLRDLVALLPMHGPLPADFDADTAAEVLLYLAGRKLVEVPGGLELEPGLELDWGAHLCQFYRSTEELLDMVVPFFAQGLREHERCIWIVSAPLTLDGARRALWRALRGAERHPDQVSFHTYEEWYLDARGRLKPLNAMLDAWVQAERRARDEGYAGLRVSGDPLLSRDDWQEFMHYEEQVHEAIGELRVKALCTYSAHRAPGELAQVMCNHHEAYVKHARRWQPVRSPRMIFQP